MDKKIGIITYHFSDNFGSVLQAYALKECIKNNGYNVNVIDYRKKEVEELYSIFKPFNSRYNILTNIYSFLNYKKISNKKIAFENFRKNELDLSKEKYLSKKDMAKCNKYHKYICGSDQVWNMDIIDFDESYMLDFVQEKERKYSYAASLGPKEKEYEKIMNYKELLNSFNNITVRENIASSVVGKVLNKSIDVVVDPVFLLSKGNWSKLSDKSKMNIPDKYVLCYFPSTVSKSMEEYSKKLAKDMNCQRILIMPEWRNLFRSGNKLYQTSPEDFIKLIKNADAVCTTSFHGVALSIIFDVLFYVEYGIKIDYRIETLLKKNNLLKQVINRKENTLELENIKNESSKFKDDIDSSLRILKKMLER